MKLQESFLLLIHFQRKEREILLLLFIKEVFVKERVIVNSKIEENLSCFLKDIFKHLYFLFLSQREHFSWKEKTRFQNATHLKMLTACMVKC